MMCTVKSSSRSATLTSPIKSIVARASIVVLLHYPSILIAAILHNFQIGFFFLKNFLRLNCSSTNFSIIDCKKRIYTYVIGSAEGHKTGTEHQEHVFSSHGLEAIILKFGEQLNVLHLILPGVWWLDCDS